MKKWVSVVLAMMLLLCALPSFAEGGKTITLWTVSSDLEVGRQMETVKKFEEENNVTVEINNSFSGWPDFWTKLMTAIAGGTAPDIVRVKETYTAELATKGALLDITDYVAADEGTKSEDFMDAMWKTVVFNDRIYGLPHLGNVITLFYNTDLFKEAGYTEPPKTWDELREYALKLTDTAKGQYGFMWYELGVREPCFAWWYGFYLMAGGELWVDNQPGGQIQLNNEAGRKALQLQIDMLYNDKSAVPPSVTTTSLAENGKVAMWMGGSWNLGSYPTTAPNLHWANAYLPGDVNQAHNALVDNLVIISQTKEPDIAYKLLATLCSQDNDYAHNAAAGQIPTHKSNLSRISDENYKISVEAFMLPETQPKPLCAGYEEVGVALATELQKAWFNQESVEECLINCEKVANEILDRVNGK